MGTKERSHEMNIFKNQNQHFFHLQNINFNVTVRKPTKELYAKLSLWNFVPNFKRQAGKFSDIIIALVLSCLSTSCLCRKLFFNDTLSKEFEISQYILLLCLCSKCFSVLTELFFIFLGRYCPYNLKLIALTKEFVGTKFHIEDKSPKI